MKETLKKIPWSWVVTIICMIACQLTAMQLVVEPVFLSLIMAFFTPPVFIVTIALLVVPAMLSITSWITLILFRWRIASLVLSGMALSIGLFANSILNKILPPS